MAADQTLGQTSEPSITNAEFARRIVKESLEQLSQQLEAGNSAQLTSYLAAMSRFRAYSISNLFLIMAQRPDATRVAGFHTWKSMGRTVKRGEKGIFIFAPIRFKSKPQDEKSEQDDDAAPVLRFRIVHVFDISQTEGKALPEFAQVQGDASEELERLEAAVRAVGVTLEYSDDLGGAFGMSAGGRIVLLKGLASAERFSVLVHEWAHEMLHKVEPSERPDRAVRELEAEAVAFVVCSAAGLETGTAAADYIRLYDGDKEKLAASLDRIQKTACAIIEAVTDDRKISASRAAAQKSSGHLR